MKKMKILALSVLMLFLFSVQGISVISARNNVSVNATLNQTYDAKIAIVYSTGGLGDLGFNDAAEIGITNAKAAMTAANKSIKVDEACESQCELTDVTTAIEDFASSSENYDLVIGIGFSALDGVNASSLAHPNTNFMLIDEKLERDNVWSITFKEHEGSFLAGAMAAMVSKSNDIAFLGGLDIPLINRFLAGYEHGARTINPDIKVRATYAPDPNNPWGDLEGGKTIAKEFISKGSDVVFAAAGGTGLGSINGVIEHNDDNPNDKVWAIGVDGDQDSYSAGDIITSMVKTVDIAVEDQIRATVFGNWTHKTENRGIKEGGVRLSVMEHTQTEANAIYEGTTTRIQKIQELTDSVLAGTLVVREFVKEDASGNKVEGQTIDFGESEEDGLPFPTVPVLLAISMAVLVIKRKRK